MINPNADDLLPHRRWMSARYIELIKRILLDYEDVFILITGSVDDHNNAVDLVAHVGNDRGVSFAGETDLGDLPSLYALSALMVTKCEDRLILPRRQIFQLSCCLAQRRRSCTVHWALHAQCTRGSRARLAQPHTITAGQPALTTFACSR